MLKGMDILIGNRDKTGKTVGVCEKYASSGYCQGRPPITRTRPRPGLELALQLVRREQEEAEGERMNDNDHDGLS